MNERGAAQVERLVDLARRYLDMDMAFVSRFDDDQQVVRAAAGDASSFDLVDTVTPLADTLCGHMVAGDIPQLIPDVRSHPRAAAVVDARRWGIGSYAGVPLRLPSGELYGAMCCISHEAKPDLSGRDLRFLDLLRDMLSDEIETEAGLLLKRRLVSDLVDGERVDIALQPILDLADGTCREVEALARFELSMGSPDVVFGMADVVGQRPPLEILCVRKALAVLEQLPPAFSLAINMSPDVTLCLEEVLDDEGPLDRLVIEITEHAAIAAYEDLRRSLAPLRQRGLRLAIDDAGAGFASLRHVVELRPDIIKIDRSLVSGIADDLARRSVVTTFVLLALDIGATVIAEGVETEEELFPLVALGVDAVQGYLVARPTTEVAFHNEWRRLGAQLPDRVRRALWPDSAAPMNLSERVPVPEPQDVRPGGAPHHS